MTLDRWEARLLAAAMYFVNPRPEEEALRIMEELVGRREAEKLAALVWRIAFSEGYSLDGWAKLLESLSIPSPWECVWRFQELAAKGLRRKHLAGSTTSGVNIWNSSSPTTLPTMPKSAHTPPSSR